ncbi:MAG: hypothetical protein ACTH4U_06880 [Pseudoalteromonas prydzensis]|uniref:hypothetical protein n=1 Tax=Pseudoalteromonas prydzensis TaxID=182141 RepID=UPI003F99CBDC
MNIEQLVIRRATVLDTPAVVKVFDEVMAWFVEMGNEGQWGSEPWSASQRRIQLLEEACALPEAWVAEDGRGHLLGVLVLGEAQPYVSHATEPEIYVRVLADSRDEGARVVEIWRGAVDVTHDSCPRGIAMPSTRWCAAFCPKHRFGLPWMLMITRSLSCSSTTGTWRPCSWTLLTMERALHGPGKPWSGA